MILERIEEELNTLEIVKLFNTCAKENAKKFRIITLKEFLSNQSEQSPREVLETAKMLGASYNLHLDMYIIANDKTVLDMVPQFDTMFKEYFTKEEREKVNIFDDKIDVSNVVKMLSEELCEDDLIQIFNDFNRHYQYNNIICTVSEYLEEYQNVDWEKTLGYINEFATNYIRANDLIHCNDLGQVEYEPNVAKTFEDFISNDELIEFLEENAWEDPYNLEKKSNIVYKFIEEMEED